MSQRYKWARGAPVAGLLLLGLLAGCALFNTAPVARITASVLSGGSPLTVVFNATESTDKDGKIVAYLWDFGDGTDTEKGKTVTHTFVAVGANKVFTVTLTVTDNYGGVDEATQTIEVRVDGGGDGTAGNGPVARMTANRQIGSTPLTITFDASDSTIADGTIREYDWDFGDGSKGVGTVATHTYKPDETEEYTVTLFVWDTLGRVSAAQLDVVVIVPDNQNDDPPIAEATATDPNRIYESTAKPTIPSLFEVTFDPRGSSADAGHEIDYYAWDFGDGTRQLETNDGEVTHIFELRSATHTYQASLTVYDDQGLDDTVLLNVTLTDD